ncbi:hypothetical protein RGU70_02860 [Herbaspirillum sp. RTI4]|uniref:hypothetical protein n=1 Tax=Herbaspirillum sp. RTI4 TaxID=3048640 RepID=UPI002AB3E35A|nr:hypothetical protein [Herbaspirillum sp. RTI4]MDY7577270.1 hypothetical protein [Herbaspirillum sp. RTI4]MEA9983534.1 hypothetical protein [Herbaspirillum sp. RTI4]
MLLDRCPKCGSSVAAHRLDIGCLAGHEIGPISTCHACKFDLRTGIRTKPISYDNQAFELLMKASNSLCDPVCHDMRWEIGRYSVMHQLARIMTTRYRHASLRDFILDRLGFPDIHLTKGHISFEVRPIEERHHLIQLAAWLLVDLDNRLMEAWRAQAVRYNLFLKDFPEHPNWYGNLIQRMAHAKERKIHF